MKRVMVFVALVAAAIALPSAQSAPADPNLWSVDTNHSAANFAVKHLLVSTVRGTLGPVKGTVWYDGKDVSTVRANVTIDVNGVNTANEGRDRHLRTADFFDVPNHPTVTFTSKRTESASGGAFKLIGDLTMRGVTKEVVLDVEAPSPVVTRPGRNAGPSSFVTGTSATTTLNRFDYGLQWNSLIEAGGGAVVGADIRVTIDLELTRR
jgi:polyisoprenoid-binding protein YceI